ncbi:type VI secretion system-associated lipoprotein [Gilliamella sp. Fer1-1]|jgi:type VI secretion system protein VasD|uniref:type VI secretion system lipoprotein TssJ n=1 Tax=unclassified Gilliamella TaxID=2685620 RepID=UPI00080E7091|nr:type VI secretion system lipoprotein TssJ [Gilliamella apicola]OCG16479.1 type VI secretion system-associated lipoprotein [Gilliamella apicola]OCG27146.1 type VI secretion system-associated lipoprotein [Gilliamella apicola]OCG28451.1 type VI secretion system-associated lipoprotein [Gilliamella apicola]OCG45645.1 type VI secretion system-associated lipoprotein [Gilliamella apicola]
MRIMNILIAILLTIWLTGCGIAQRVSEKAADLSNSIFTWDVRTLHLDITARSELNMDDDGHSSPVVIRIYQLKETDAFNSVSYQEIVEQDSDALKESMIESKEIVLKPNTASSIDVSFDQKAKAVGIAALYKEPNLNEDNWRLVLKRGDLNITKPREIIASQYTIKLVDEK